MPTYLDGDRTWLGSLPLNSRDDSGVDWIVTSNDGWKGAAATTQQVTQRQADHGGYASAAYLTPKNLPLNLTIIAPSEALLDTAIEQLKTATSVTAPTVMRVQSAAYDRSATVYRLGETLVAKYGAAAEISLSLVAPDPRLYSTTGYTGSCQLPSVTGGLGFPITFPITFPAVVSSGEIPVGNLGTIASRPMLRITGPVTIPVITLQAPDGSVQQLLYNGSLGPSDWLDLDCDRHTATLDGTANRRGLLTVTGGWPQIPPGATGDTCSINFNASSTSGVPVLSAAWFDAWE